MFKSRLGAASGNLSWLCFERLTIILPCLCVIKDLLKIWRHEERWFQSMEMRNLIVDLDGQRWHPTPCVLHGAITRERSVSVCRNSGAYIENDEYDVDESFHVLWQLLLLPEMTSHTVIANLASAIQISPPHHVVLSEKQTRWHGILNFHKWPLRYDFMGHQFYIPLKIPFRWTGIFLQISVLILFLFQLLSNKLTKKKVCKEIKCRAKSYTINGRFAECLMSKAFG